MNKGLKKIIVLGLIFIPIIMFLVEWNPLKALDKEGEYVDEAVRHINKMKEFNEALPRKIKNLDSEEAYDELEEEIVIIRADIIQFNGLEHPDRLEDIPEEFEKRNELIDQELSDYIKVMDNSPEQYENLSKVIKYLTDMLDENNDLVDGWKEQKL